MRVEFPDSLGISHPSPASTNWEAELELGFSRSSAKTVLSKKRHRGPLTVQRAFYPEGGICHIYLLHPPGGVVAGDQLSISAGVDSGAQALITTPAAGKFYRSNGGTACQNIQLTVASHATLEWLPQENIIYQGAQLNSNLHLQLANQAGFIGWEVLALGRPAAGEGFAEGLVRQNWRIERAGRLFYLENIRLDGAAYRANWGLQGHSACGSLFACPCTPLQLSTMQNLLAELPTAGVTLIGDMLICRAIDQRADRLRDLFQQIWMLIRPDIVHQPACAPRIWAT
ncbi:urease accessory protein UreD [Methylomonas paludis]|uniref:Urease accessory protein UreD n=1 Tax=Methylomonas paludis TaxID=1173101 RepID=A0A975R9B1_9GAMM|nr:urease accessory protein UreD [Methylomonas paludis]QWF69996.1 urease accessory protein UreD [Methylomonas paludis]